MRTDTLPFTFESKLLGLSEYVFSKMLSACNKSYKFLEGYVCVTSVAHKLRTFQYRRFILFLFNLMLYLFNEDS